ncbi:MAG: TAXI family TRAP transporter solute-binding subunit [Gloeocapsa sp. DLM2.Bin57]|nr:MAG: TAXI family TRAP transporter solute-binding subunit [Gloeocapsa sp. DLM2.Bin57]
MSRTNKLIWLLVLFSITAAIAVTSHWIYSQRQVHTLTMATGGKTGVYYAFGNALATVVSRHQPNIRIEVIETSGSQENEELISEHEVDLAILQADTSVNNSVKAMTFLFPEMFHLIARVDSGINNFSDLKGKKIALMPIGSGSYNLFWPLSQHYGIYERDFEGIPMSPSEAHQALLDGEVDALFRIIALGNESVTELLQNEQVTLIPIDQASALQLVLPAVEPNVIPMGAYNGAIPIPSEDLPVVGVRAVLLAHKSVNPNLVQEITRIIFEARNDLIRKNPQSAMISKPDHINELGFSFHEGAKFYYNQDEPSFLERYAEAIGLILSITMLVISGIWQFRIWLQEKQKNRADRYNLQIIQLIERINTSNSIAELEEIQTELFQLFNKVVEDLDRDRISAESFQSFTFPWDVAFNSIRHREVLLSNGIPELNLKKS